MFEGNPASRLVLCEVCNHIEAKYTCPKCEVKTCCLKCVNIHKKELECNGIRDKTKFIPIKQMTNIDFMSDYTFLEQCTRYVSDRKSDKIKHHTRFNKNLPTHLFKLRCAANERKINLKFLLKLFTKHNANTTFYDWKEKIIHWRVEWIFPHAEMVKFVDERCNEHDTLDKLLTKYISPVDPTEASYLLINKHLEYYQSKDRNELQVLLKAEGVKGCNSRFFAMDMSKTLKENLAGKIIVEFPIMYVVYKSITSEFNVIESDDDIDKEAELYKEEMEKIISRKRKIRKFENGGNNSSAKRNRKSSKEDNANFLFSSDKIEGDDNSSGLDDSNSSEVETEEEN